MVTGLGGRLYSRISSSNSCSTLGTKTCCIPDFTKGNVNLRVHNVKGGDASLILYPLFRLTHVKKNRVMTFYNLL